jgi:protein-disulfide isomerase
MAGLFTRSRPFASLRLALTLLGSLLALGSASGCAPPAPPVIVDIQRGAARERPTVVLVDFVDFECPYCRASHLALAPVLRENPRDIIVVRKHVPLAFHPHALTAARASICAEAQGKEAEMADLLVTTMPALLDEEGCAQLATKLGLDLPRYLACVEAPATEERIRKDMNDFRAAKLEAVPTMFVGDEKLEGEQTETALRSAFKRARRAITR